jgi:hypothetical protein
MTAAARARASCTPTNQRALTTSGGILIVSAEIGEATIEALAVACWKRFPAWFGLAGYRDQYPDVARVFSKVHGSVGLIGKCLLERVDGSPSAPLRITARGRREIASFA